MNRRIVHIDRVSSTQDAAKKMTWLTLGEAIVADVQDRGRGQRGHEWISPLGGLYASIILHSDPLLAVRAGVALARALQQLEIDARLKWPNDILVAGKKIAGILIEAKGKTAIVGVGVNIDRTPVPNSTCVIHHTDSRTSPDKLLHSILHNLEITYKQDVLEAYRDLCTTLGHIVEVSVGDKTIAGNATSIDRLGHLILKTESRLRIIHSGECSHLST
jgi:BirA family transcriptional regulator, biotin operon repressor / biotin---[acetyl-CoA-carboxylase] ligase